MNKQLVLFSCMFWIFIFIFSMNTYARNMGVVGQTYPIVEQDFLSWIQNRLTRLQSEGKLQALQHEWVNRVQASTNHPSPVRGITTTQVEKQWLWDPTVVLLSAIKDTNGNIIVPAGAHVNPLEIISLKQPLIFYNADDPKQIQWVKKIERLYHSTAKLILVKGSISTQINLFHKPIYFDQEGRLTQRFHIQHVPALVKQEALQLRIQEVLI